MLTPFEIGPSNASPGYQKRKERNGTNKKYVTRYDLNPGPSAYRADALPTELRCQLAEPEFNPYRLTHLQITPPLSLFRVDLFNDMFLIVDSSFFCGCPQLILFT